YSTMPRPLVLSPSKDERALMVRQAHHERFWRAWTIIERMARRASSCVLLAALLLSSGAILSSDAPLPAILVSRQLAARAHIAAGDKVTLAADPGGTRSKTFLVAGIYEPTPDPMRFTAERLEARMHLPDMTALATDANDSAAADTVGAVNVKLLD